MVVDELAGLAVLAVAHRFGADGPHHLRMAVVAALGEVDVATGQLERRVRLHRGDRRHVGLDQEGRDDLEQRGDDDGHGDHHREGHG